MGIITNIITLLSVIYAVGCTSFLATNSPQQYYNTAYVSVAVMMFILLLRFIYIKIRSLNNDCKKNKIIDTIMYPMYYLTGLFELNIKYGYGNTIGISGVEEKIGLLYTMGISYKICNLLSILIFIIAWIVLILKFKYAMDCKQIIKNKAALLLIALGSFITIKCIIGILFNTNTYNVYLDIVTAHIIYWFVYFISMLIYKLLLKNKSSNL
ncbi:hypothetical protein [Ruminococcus sp. 210702-SL.1.03]|jgi:hypothetical protein|uniref:hypothetical protein n=1 Tax=Ruminococcus sp. 210702-SL.1.03 TaxID=2883233 RepID=UPI001D095278|nr:hypothetical protein [Ruminococcus sp. 210702-SL.1.03]MCB6616653.1 hypothetical protein [Ruminococcus sp. 210702-SL.1.03]